MVAALLAIACLALAACGDDGEDAERPQAELRGAATLDKRFDGVPQRGAILGDTDAPFTLVEFADLQCPYCAKYDREVLPAVIERYVRPGRLRLDLRPVAFLGPDSGTGAAATVAAGLQNRMWQYADLFYRNQGAENSGYATPAFLGRIAEASGLDFERWQSESNSPRLVAILEENAREARSAGVAATPTFRLGRTGAVLAPFAERTLPREEFLRRLDQALRR